MKRRKKSSFRRNYLLMIFLIAAFASLIGLSYLNYPLSIRSPENTTYEDGKIFINVYSNRHMNWINDSFDSEPLKNECTMCSSFNILGYDLSPGTHSYLATAQDQSGKIFSQNVVFTTR